MIKLSKGNLKLGKNIFTFSLPPINTCPQATTECTEICYAKKSFKQYPNVREAWEGNLKETKKKGFVKNFNELLVKKKKGTICRLHVSGDIYDKDYLKSLISIVENNKDIIFYGYTRMWRDSSFHPLLLYLNSLENMTLFASTDDETYSNKEKPPKALREAYMGTKYTKEDLNLIQCPEQSGKIDSCEACGYCFKSFHKNHNRGVLFTQH